MLLENTGRGGKEDKAFLERQTERYWKRQEDEERQTEERQTRKDRQAEERKTEERQTEEKQTRKDRQRKDKQRKEYLKEINNTKKVSTGDWLKQSIVILSAR